MSRDLTECPDCGMAYQWHDAENCYHIQKSKLEKDNEKLKEYLKEACHEIMQDTTTGSFDNWRLIFSRKVRKALGEEKK